MKPIRERFSIALVGAINPQILQPSWFGAHNLIASSEDKVANAQIKIVHPSITEFLTDNFSLQAVPERVFFATENASFAESLRDLAVGTFTILRHTPITKMGINREFDFALADESTWHALGHKLAPKDSWNDVLRNPGMFSLTMEGKRDNDQHNGYIRVKVEPSKRTRFGVYVEVNDHYEVKPSERQDASEMISILSEVWDSAVKNASKIVQRIIFEEGA